MANIPNVTPLPEEPQVFDISKTAVGEGQDITVASGISTLAELREKAPPLYKAIMDSIAYQICSRSNESVQRIKKILDEAERTK